MRVGLNIRSLLNLSTICVHIQPNLWKSKCFHLISLKWKIFEIKIQLQWCSIWWTKRQKSVMRFCCEFNYFRFGPSNRTLKMNNFKLKFLIFCKINWLAFPFCIIFHENWIDLVSKRFQLIQNMCNTHCVLFWRFQSKWLWFWSKFSSHVSKVYSVWIENFLPSGEFCF